MTRPGPKARSEELVVKVLATKTDQTAAQIAKAVGRSRTGISGVLLSLERAGLAHRVPGGRANNSPLPDRWSICSPKKSSRKDPPAPRLGRGQLDELVANYLATHVDEPVGATVVAKALGRSAGAVRNCLTRLESSGRVRLVAEEPRRYTAKKSRSPKAGQARHVPSGPS